ncbi:MAG: formylglycine-generating enzyme family protein [Cyanobacteria bacterium J06636_16]
MLYQTSDLKSFKVHINNVQALKQVLQQAGYEVFCLHNELLESSDQLPTNRNIRAALNRIWDEAREGDFVLIYFAGLTALEALAWGLLPYDARSRSDGILGLEIQHIWEAKSEQKGYAVESLFVLDLVDTDIGEQSNSDLFSDIADASIASGLSVMLMTMSLDAAIARQSQYSLLGELLLKGLQGQADRAEKGFVSLNDLADYLLQEGQSLIKQSAGEMAGPLFKSSGFISDLPLVQFDTLSIHRQPQRSQCFTEPAIKLDLMLIPGGTFTMGSPSDELGRWNNEEPQHEVTLPTFLMGRYPVTQAQWHAVTTMPKQEHDLDPDPSEFKGDDRLVESVSWYDAMEFCKRLSAHTGHTYRLPTEAEWEYACRASTDTPFHFGESITTDLANYCGEDDESDPDKYPGNYGKGPKGVYRQETTPVNHFHPLANAFGLCDMHGNVWEWCLDHWHSDYEEAPNDGSAWLTEDEGASRVLRGGSWDLDPRNCRSASRNDDNPGLRYDIVGLGFRVVCEARGL